MNGEAKESGGVRTKYVVRESKAENFEQAQGPHSSRGVKAILFPCRAPFSAPLYQLAKVCHKGVNSFLSFNP